MLVVGEVVFVLVKKHVLHHHINFSSVAHMSSPNIQNTRNRLGRNVAIQTAVKIALKCG